MIYSIGTDIIEVKRIEQAIERFGKHFLDRLFCAEEQNYCNRFRDSGRHFAGRFAAKEAIVKALGKGVNWLDITISNDSHGKPIVILSDNLMHMFDSPNILISISHCREYATAFALAQN